MDFNNSIYHTSLKKILPNNLTNTQSATNEPIPNFHKISSKNQEPPFLETPPSTFISKAVQKCLKNLHKEAAKSLEWIASAKKITTSAECETMLQNYKDTIVHIDRLASFLLTVDELTDEDRESIKHSRTQLASLHKELNINKNELNEHQTKQAEKGIAQADSLLGQLQTLAESTIAYQKKSKPLENLAQIFCSQWESNPLNAMEDLLPLLKSMSKFHREAKLLNKALKNSLSSVKIHDIHEFQMKCLNQEIEDWNLDIEKELNNQLKHLKYLASHDSTLQQNRALKQLGALKNYITEHLDVLHKLKQSPDFTNLPKATHSILDDLSNTLTKVEKRLHSIKESDAGDLRYGSETWNLLVQSRPPIPEGILSRAFSYLNPLGLIPEKWRPTTTQITNAFLIALMVSNEVSGITRRFSEAKNLQKHADELQKEVFRSVSHETSQKIQKEAGWIGNLLGRGMSKINWEKVVEKYPNTLPTLKAAYEKFGNNTLTQDEITKIMDHYVTSRMIEVSPIGNPLNSRWTHLWPNTDMQDASESSSPPPTKAISNASAINDTATSIINDNGEMCGLQEIVSNKTDSGANFWNKITELSAAHTDLGNTITTLNNLTQCSLLDHQDSELKLVSGLKKQSSELNAELTEILTNLTSHNNSAENKISIIPSANRTIRSVESIKTQVETLIRPYHFEEFNAAANPPEELEAVYKKENRQLIEDVIKQPATPPTDIIYANLIGLYRPDIKKTAIQNISLEGVPPEVPFTYLLDTQKAYLIALKSHPEFSTGCREEVCHAIFGNTELAKTASKDNEIINTIIKKIEFSRIFKASDPIQQGRMLENAFNQLKPGDETRMGEIFFFEVELIGIKTKHSMVMEIEKSSDGTLILRLFNTGLGIRHHGQGTTQFGEGYLQFDEIVDIDPMRLFGGGFTDFLKTIASPRDGNKDWNPASFYNNVLASVGGKISNRKESSTLLRDDQYIGNCGFASAFAALDKSLISAALAERMRSLTLFRATKAYYETNLQEIIDGADKESKRSLLLIGSQATFESIQRSIEVGGLIGKEADSLLKAMNEIYQKVLKLQKEDLGVNNKYSLNLNGYQKLIVSNIEYDPSLIEQVNTESLFKNIQPGTRENATRPTTRKPNITFTPIPFEDKNLERLNELTKQLNSQENFVNNAAIITSIDFEPLFNIGPQAAKDFLTANAVNSLKITDNIALFNLEIKNFLDNDRLQMVQKLLVDPETLKLHLRNDQGFISTLKNYLEKGRTIGSVIQNAALEAYFAYLSRTVEIKLKEALSSSELKHSGISAPTFLNSSAIFQQMIADSDPIQEQDRLKLIHFFRIKSFEAYTQLSAEETAELLSSVNYLQKLGYPQSFSKEAAEEIEKVQDLIEVAQSHLDNLSSASMILNQIAFDIDREHDMNSQWKLHPGYDGFLNEDKTIFYNSKTHSLSKITSGRVEAPRILKDHLLFTSIVDDPEIHLERLQDNTYIYSNPQGIKYRFIVTGKDVSVQRNFDSEWFQATDPKGRIVVGQKSNKPWHEGGILWVPLSEQKHAIYFSGPKGSQLFKLISTASSTKKSSSFFQSVEKFFFNKNKDFECQLLTLDLQETGLSLANASQTSFSDLINKVEDPQYTFPLVRDGQLAKVILPRLDLEFEAGAHPTILPSKTLSGFGLFSGEQAIPMLGDFTEYLPLKKIHYNGKEELGVLIPFREFDLQRTEGLKTPTELVKVNEDWQQQVPYFFYRIQGDLLIPEVSTDHQAMQANLHLAAIFLSERRFDEAQHYLLTIVDKLFKRSPQVDQTTANTLLQLASFIKINQDITPDAVALRLRAEAILRRLIALHQTPFMNVNALNDYNYYIKHISRIKKNFLLTNEENQLLLKVYPVDKPVPPSQFAFPISKSQEISHKELTIDSTIPILTPSSESLKIFPHPLANSTGTAGSLIVSTHPLFINAFPEEILSLYALLKAPENIGLSDLRLIANQFGLDPLMNAVSLKTSMTTVLELRYRFLIDYIKVLSQNDKALSNDTSSIEANNRLLTSELNLIGTLILTSFGGTKPSRELEEDATKHKNLLATISTLPEYSNEFYIHKSLHERLKGDALKEALKLWENWVTPNALPIPLSINFTTRTQHAVVAPVLTQSLLKLQEGETPQEFITSYSSLNKVRPATIIYNCPISNADEMTACFTKEELKSSKTTSPFTLTATEPFIAKAFKAYDTQFNKYLKDTPSLKFKYELIDQPRLSAHVTQLKNELTQIEKRIAYLQEHLVEKLNKLPNDPSLKAHVQTRLARGVVKELTIDDAKIALSRGWDIEYLKSLNPNLSEQDIGIIFERTLELLLEIRETQKRARIIKAASTVLNGNASSPLWQSQVSQLMKTIQEKSYFDPYDYPALLLAETEYDIALWKDQVPAINQLAPRQQVSALVELAMGLGKTDVISPTVLCLLADGQTLPILVMPEALIPSVAARLQDRIKQGFNMEIRVIPIDRGDWTEERITALHNELIAMKDQRIPLLWSSTDIQTILNSFLESYVEITRQSTVSQKDIAIIDAWKKLFSFMISSVEIIGDEIHVIMDFLTAYSFSLGTPQSLNINEMDAVADFIKVVFSHPDVANKVSLLGKNYGTPFTKEFFDEVLSPKIINTLIDRGIINDPQSKEVLEQLKPQEKEWVRNYLSSKPHSKKLEEHRFFPKISPDDLEITNENSKDSLFSKFLRVDQPRLSKSVSYEKCLAEANKIIAEYEYKEIRIHNYMAVQKESIRIVFPLTAMAQKGKHYALNEEGTSAIPSDEGTTLWDAQFGTSLERLYYTAFLFAQQKIPKDVIRQDLMQYTQKYQTHMATFVEDVDLNTVDLNELVSNNPFVKEFKERYGTLCPLKQRDFTEIEINQLTDWINEKIERQIPLIRDYYFIEQKSYPEDIETSTHMFPLIAKPRIGLKGTSGTLYNLATYPKAFTDNPYLSMTTPMIIERIKSSSLHNSSISLDLSASPQNNLNSLYANSQHGPCSIIDTTGYFKKEHSEEYARLMLEAIHQKHPEIEHIAYYQENTIYLVKLNAPAPILYKHTDPHDDPKLVIDRQSIAAFWDVAHTTGSDIPINLSAHGILIIGRHIRLFQLLQAAMRLRGLDSGQTLEISIPNEDRVIMIAQLNKYFKLGLKKDQALTIDQVIQYGFLNEVISESDNNWSVVDARMKMVILKPVMNLLWDVNLPAEHTMKIFDLVKSLFLKNKAGSPAELYGHAILKMPVEKAKKKTLESWINHPILAAIEKHPDLFPGLDKNELIKQLEEIALQDPGPVQSTVDSEHVTGLRTRTKNKVQTKVKSKTKTLSTETKQKTRTELRIKKEKTPETPVGPLSPLRRKPYTPYPVIPFSSDIFRNASYTPMALEEASKATFEDLQPNELAKKGIGAIIKMSDLLTLEGSLSNTLKMDDEDLLVSLNLSPVWTAPEGVSPLYNPYHFFQKYAAHALLIYDPSTQRLKLELIDPNDSQTILNKLEQDRTSPNQTNEVQLSLYHLHENRVIASGKHPIDLQNTTIQSRKDTLVTQAKLLTGITQYTSEESDFLNGWMKNRDAKEVLNHFVFKIAQYRENTLDSLLKSDLAKILINNGIESDQIKELVNSPQVKNMKQLYRLLFDRRLIPQQWLEIAKQMTNELKSELPSIAAKWSDILVPMITLGFDMLNLNGIITRNHQEMFDDGVLKPSMAQRRWLMNTFFPTVSDEYGAWRTAVPQFKGGISLSFLQTLQNQNKGSDADNAYLENATHTEYTPPVPSIAKLDQLETMSELAHPIWGLPEIAYSNDFGEFDTIAELMQSRSTNPNPGNDPIIKNILNQAADNSLAYTIADQAIAHIDLVASLKLVNETYPDYPFERLYGIFAYLAKCSSTPEARREYALLMLPRLFGEKFGKDMRFYTQFIPDSLIVNPEGFSKEEINTLLTECFVNSKATNPLGVVNSDQSPSIEERMSTLKAFTKDAPANVATITAKWTNHLIENTSESGWWLDSMIIQLLLRNEPLIDHKNYQIYFDNMINKQRHIREILNSHLTQLSAEDKDIILYWQLNDFDLLSQIVPFKTLNAPLFTPYQKANRWATVLTQFMRIRSPSEYYRMPSKDFWNRILGDISVAVRQSPPVDEIDKIPLRNLIEALDAYSLHLDIMSFESLQEMLGPIRLAAYYAFDVTTRQTAAFEEIKMLPSRDADSHKIFLYFIKQFLLPSTEVPNIVAGEINSLFDGLHKLPSNQYDLKQWTSLFKDLLDSFTVKGTYNQKTAFSSWVSSLLQSKSTPSTMSDATVINALIHFPQYIEHNDLVNYVENRGATFIPPLNPDSKIDYSNNDFELFSELFELNTANRKPLSFVKFAEKMTKSLTVPGFKPSTSEDPSRKELYNILHTINKRNPGKLLPTNEKAILSNFVKAIGSVCDQGLDFYNDLVYEVNLFRLASDYSDPNPNVNAKRALIDAFNDNSFFKRRSLSKLIPILYSKTSDSSWLNDGLEQVENTNFIYLYPVQETILTEIVSAYPSEIAQFINQKLSNSRSESTLINFLLKKIINKKTINHNKLKEYFENNVRWKSEFLESFSTTWASIAADHFNVFAEFSHLPTQNRPSLTVNELVDFTSTFVSSTTKLDNDIGLPVLQKLNSFAILSTEDGNRLSDLIKTIDKQIHQFSEESLIEFDKLRLKIDFRGTPRENIIKAFKELAQINDFRLSNRFESFIKNHLFKQISSSEIPLILDQARLLINGRTREFAFLLLKSNKELKAAHAWLSEQDFETRKIDTIDIDLLKLLVKENPSSVDFHLADRMWTKMSSDEKCSLCKSLLGVGNLDYFTKTSIPKFDLSMVLTITKVTLLNQDNSLSNLLDSAIKIYETEPFLFLDFNLEEKISKKLPRSFLGFGSKLSDEELSRLKELVKLLKSARYDYKKFISKLEAYL